MTSRSVSPSMFHGLPWETWTNVLGRTSPQQDDEEEFRGQQIPKPVPISSVMKLHKEDMRLFGVSPEREAFSVIVCELCSLNVTPQGLLNHMELRHKQPPQPTVASPPPTVEKLPNKLVKPMKVITSKVKPKKSVVRDSSNAKKCVDTGAVSATLIPLRVPTVMSIETPITPPKETAPTHSKEELLQPVVALTPISSPLSPTAPLLTKPSAAHLVTPPNALPTLSSSAPKPIRPGRSDRKCVPIKEREYDPDKHCGVAVNTSAEPAKPCTRSLTCKSHSMSLRRAVIGRSKSFDQLLADHRQAKEVLIRGKKLLETKIIPLTSKKPPCSQLNQDRDKPKEKEHPTLLVTSTTGTTTVIGGSFRTIRGDVGAAEGEAQEVTIHMPISMSLLSPVSIPSPGLPDLSIDVMAEKANRLSSTPKSFTFKHQIIERLSSLTMVGTRKVQTQLDVSLTNTHPKSLSVCTFSSHKIGGLIYTNRRMQVARQGLEGALHRGNLGNGIYTRELYANMPIPGNNTSAISNVLNNVSTKALYQRSKGITRTKNSDKPSKKIALMGLPKQGTSILNVPLSLKSVVPKPFSVSPSRTTLPPPTSTASITLKNNGQFHIPNILGGALKRSADTGTSPTTQQLNTAQIIGSLLSNHTKNGLPQNKNNLPLVRVAITNGIVDGDSKAIYSTNLIGEISKASDNTNSNITVNQNVRLTTAQNGNHVVPQITYLTTAPVTFQQLPVLSSQQKYPGLSSAN